MINAAGKRLVVRIVHLAQPREKTLLIIPGEREQLTVEVVAMGSEVDKMIELDDILFLPQETGIPVEIDGEHYLSIIENQILAAWRDK